ncbi:hybrid sensor histidine kinase/response regulator [Salisaeta longa]|uniref:hybrid sensor histidine kinase/response regulator n=1 Tax=Salisaeta longa TaxID=503170 RepID=UPI0003B5A49E|nr:ATP-binding protein [Salisaeta longa]
MLPVDAELLIATGTADGSIVHCNDAWRSVIGPRSTPWARLSDDDAKLALTALGEAAAGTLVTNQIVSATVADRDDPLPVLLNFIPVKHEDDASKAVTVTGEVMAEPSTWMNNQTTRHRMEALGRMTMGVAHDLNNLLSGLLGHIELLGERVPKDAPDMASALQTIDRAASDGAALINKLQRYIRQDTEVHFAPVDLPELVEDCIKLTQPYWRNEPRRQGIRIDVVREFEPVPPVQGAATELREVFVNLILNAVQAMPAGGVLTFRTWHDPASGVNVSVEDTGTGMPEKVQQRIFDPLFTTKGDQGTGMGLAASYGIVREHQAAIEVDSTEGEGSTFTITFPSSDQEAPTAPTAPAPSEAPAPARVLVVDDEEMVRSTLTKLLKLKGHTVHTASSGPDALSIVDDTALDIVFTDFGMPEMTGAVLAQTLHDRQPSLPVVLLTGYTEPDVDVRHVRTVLTKPFKLADLQEVIHTYVQTAR